MGMRVHRIPRSLLAEFLRPGSRVKAFAWPAVETEYVADGRATSLFRPTWYWEFADTRSDVAGFRVATTLH